MLEEDRQKPQKRKMNNNKHEKFFLPIVFSETSVY